MRVLDRYTTIEFLKAFLLALAALSTFSLLFGVGVEAVREGGRAQPVR